MLQMLHGQRFVHLHGSNAQSKYASTFGGLTRSFRGSLFRRLSVAQPRTDRRVLTFYPVEILRSTQTPLISPVVSNYARVVLAKENGTP